MDDMLVPTRRREVGHVPLRRENAAGVGSIGRAKVVSPPTAPREKVVIRIIFRVPGSPFRNLRLPHIGRRWLAAFGAAIVLFAAAVPTLQILLQPKIYALSGPEQNLLPKDEPSMAKLMQYDKTKTAYTFNKAAAQPSGQSLNFGYDKAQATIGAGKEPYVSVTDPHSNDEFKMIPVFGVQQPYQRSNHVTFALSNGNGHLVYTTQASGVKEDITLRSYAGKTQAFDYDISNNGDYVAQVETDGSVGIYGYDLPISGNVSTGSASDAALLQKMRQQAKRTKLVFTIPAPVVKETNRQQSAVDARFSVRDKGKTLRITATNLEGASYPISIDPSVSVTSISDVFRDMNPESNVDFDGSTGNIVRGQVTGGIIPGWTTNANSLANARFLQSTAINDDYIYVAGGAPANSTSNLTSVEFAKIDSTGSSVGAWSSTVSLPAALSRFRLIPYNGYLYAIGGSVTSSDCSSVSSAVYYVRIQVNGQLSSSWSSTTNLPAGLCSLGATVYNGVLYVAGGRTGSAPNSGVTTVSYATIQPDGSLSSWTNDNSVLPSAMYGSNLRAYNGYLYVIGGNRNGTLSNQVLYAPIASDGSIYGSGSGSWLSASSFTTPRSNMGVSFSVVADGFIYVGGGCGTFNASQSCTNVLNDVQIAQVNADGTLGPWSPVQNVTLARTGGSLKSWRGTLYSIAGCTAMNSGSVSCANSSTTLASQSYGQVSSPGEVGPVTTTTAMPTAVFAHGAVVNNGYLYVVGGCQTNSCQTGTNDTTGNVSYAPINSDGSLSSWTTDSTNRLNGSTGLAAFGLAVYNNVLYATGGYTKAGPSRNVWYVGLNGNGSLSGAWTTLTSKLSTTDYYNSAVAHHGFLYVFGGCIGTTGSAGCSTYRSQVWRMPINSDGSLGTTVTSTGTSTTLRSLPTATGLMAPALYNGYIYLAGGANGSSGQTDTVLYANIQDNGNISSWSTATGHLVQTIRRADAAAMNGYLYVFGGHNGSIPATYDYIQIGKINMATGDITNDFSISVTRITQRWDERAVYTNGHFYVTGGCSVGDPPASCSTRTNVDENVELFNAGNKGTSAWSNASNVYATNRTGAGSVAAGGYLYAAGGCTAYTVASSTCTGFTNTTAYAPLNPDGSIGSWTTGAALPAQVAHNCLVAVGGYLYSVGGEDNTGNAVTTVYYSQLTNGVPGSWQTAANGLPGARAAAGCTVFNGYIYITGGRSGTTTAQTTVYYSPDLSNGGNITSSWNTATDFTTARYDHTSVAAGGYLYVMGGGTSSAYDLDVQFVALDPSTGNTTGSWKYARDLPNPIRQQSIVAANGYIYLFGGRSASTTCSADTWVASINSTGTLSDWQTSINNFTTARFDAGGAFYNGYYYVLGGDDCTNVISSNVIQYGGEQSQAMKTLVTKYLDMAGDAKPQKFVAYLTNAVNNGVDIEKWRLTYKSSANLANTWGMSASIYPLASQASYTTNAYDGSGTDIQLARWYELSFDINMEQSFTFTDDTQPTISRYDFYYSPTPSRRLMHGRDFRDQTQQGLDLNL
ncbi:MAG TPA: hypothetical protein VF466_05565 [Candidatus Saccharimonadales bacterium]